MLYGYRDKAKYRSKVAIFSYTTCIRRPVSGVPIGILPLSLVQKTRTVWIPDGKKSFRICLVVEYRTRNQEVAGSTHGPLQATLNKLLTYCVLRPTQLPTLSGTGNE